MAYCDAAPTNEVRFKIVVGQAVAGSSGVTVGEVIFAAGAKVGTVSMVANANLGIPAGGQLYIIAPSTVDATLSGLEVAIPYDVIGETLGGTA